MGPHKGWLFCKAVLKALYLLLDASLRLYKGLSVRQAFVKNKRSRHFESVTDRPTDGQTRL